MLSFQRRLNEMRRPKELDLTDPEAVIIELLCTLRKDKLRTFLRQSLRAGRNPRPDEETEQERGGFLFVVLSEAADRHPKLVAHFNSVPQLLSMWGNKFAHSQPRDRRSRWFRRRQD